MAEYLLPYNKMSISQKRKIFEIRNKMVDIPDNFSSDSIENVCICGQRGIMSHIYYCNILSENKNEKVLYEKIYDGNLVQQIEVCKRFEENLKVRERIKNQFENSTLPEKEKSYKK